MVAANPLTYKYPMRAKEFTFEGGWSSPLTQNTVITPQLVEQVFKILHVFVNDLNNYLIMRGIPTVELGYPCGSTTYYKRDLVQNPTKEYGDIDVNLFIPRIEGMTNNANSSLIYSEVKHFCDASQDFQTQNGTNVIFKVGEDYVQVDLITAYYHNKEWTTALAPEHKIKGVLCNSLYSSLGEALNLSIGSGHGVQAKIQNGALVPFAQNKDVELITITNNPHTWAVDIAKYFGCRELSPLLKQYPGKLDEIRVADMINSIKGIAQSLEMSGKGDAATLISKIKGIYLGKIDRAINSSKFDKAATPMAIEKAKHTKEMLAKKSAEIAANFDK